MTSSTARLHPTVDDLRAIADRLWPFDTQESWDASALCVGRGERAVNRVLVAVDPTAEVLEEAIAAGAQLIVTHHPLLLRGVNAVVDSSPKGQLVTRLIEHGIALMCCHTSADKARRGVSEALLAACGVSNGQPLVPEDSAGEAEAIGLGRVGDLAQPTTLEDLAQRLASEVPATATGVRVAGDRQMPVRRVAVCGGAGDSLLETAAASGADVYVTADLRHHPVSEAREQAQLRGGRPAIIDLSHAASEWLWAPYAAADLARAARREGFALKCVVSGVNTDPWDFRVESSGDPGRWGEQDGA